MKQHQKNWSYKTFFISLACLILATLGIIYFMMLSFTGYTGEGTPLHFLIVIFKYFLAGLSIITFFYLAYYLLTCLYYLLVGLLRLIRKVLYLKK